jgi:cathepsin A (carboxypeptidase C)
MIIFKIFQYANLLLIESPTGVGYSYDTENFPDSTGFANDDRTAQQNYMALKDFFTNVHPQLNNRTFFLGGESYAGIYVPTLARLIVDGIASGDFINPNFQVSKFVLNNDFK